MKIFLETHNLNNPYSGFGQFNYKLIEAMSKLDLSGLDITISSGKTTELKKDFGNSFTYHLYKSFTRYSFFRIRKRYDLWHSMNQNTKIEPHQNLPYLLTVHDVNFMEEFTGGRLDEHIARFKEKLHRANSIVYISKYAQEMTHKYFTVHNVKETIIYNGSPEVTDVPEAFEPSCNLTQPFLFTIGGLIPKKNFHTLVEMLQFLPDYQLIIAGKNTTKYADEIRELMHKYDLLDRVFLPGKISEQEKYYYYKRCAAFVFPSLREGFGIPPIEAMKMGKPVIAANSSSIPEVCGDNAAYWDHFEPEYMSKIVLEAIETYNSNMDDLSKQYRNHAESYSWETAAQQYLEIYRSFQ